MISGFNIASAEKKILCPERLLKPSSSLVGNFKPFRLRQLLKISFFFDCVNFSMILSKMFKFAVANIKINIVSISLYRICASGTHYCRMYTNSNALYTIYLVKGFPELTPGKVFPLKGLLYTSYRKCCVILNRFEFLLKQIV